MPRFVLPSIWALHVHHHDGPFLIPPRVISGELHGATNLALLSQVSSTGQGGSFSASIRTPSHTGLDKGNWLATMD